MATTKQMFTQILAGIEEIKKAVVKTAVNPMNQGGKIPNNPPPKVEGNLVRPDSFNPINYEKSFNPATGKPWTIPEWAEEEKIIAANDGC